MKNLPKPIDLQDVERADLVNVANDLLGHVVKASSIKDGKKFDERKMKEARIILAYLNVVNRTMTTKMRAFKMINGLEEKQNTVKRLMQQRVPKDVNPLNLKEVK